MEPKFCVQASFGSQKKTLECESYHDAEGLSESLELAGRRCEIVLAIPTRSATLFVPHNQFDAVVRAIEQSRREKIAPVPTKSLQF